MPATDPGSRPDHKVITAIGRLAKDLFWGPSKEERKRRRDFRMLGTARREAAMTAWLKSPWAAQSGESLFRRFTNGPYFHLVINPIEISRWHDERKMSDPDSKPGLFRPSTRLAQTRRHNHYKPN